MSESENPKEFDPFEAALAEVLASQQKTDAPESNLIDSFEATIAELSLNQAESEVEKPAEAKPVDPFDALLLVPLEGAEADDQHRVCIPAQIGKSPLTTRQGLLRTVHRGELLLERFGAGIHFVVAALRVVLVDPFIGVLRGPVQAGTVDQRRAGTLLLPVRAVARVLEHPSVIAEQ